MIIPVFNQSWNQIKAMKVYSVEGETPDFL